MEIIIFFLPVLVALVMAAMVTSKRYKTLSQRLLIAVLLNFAGYFICDAFVVFPYSPASAVVVSYVVMSFFAIAIPISTCVLAWSLVTNRQRPGFYLFWIYLLPTLLLLLELMNYSGLGFDNALDYMAHGRMLPSGLDNFDIHKYELFSFIAIKLLAILCGIGQLISFVYLIYLLWYTDFTPRVFFRWLTGKAPIRPMHLLFVIFMIQVLIFNCRVTTGGQYLKAHSMVYSLICLGTCLCTFWLGTLGMKLRRPCIFRGKPTHPHPRFADMPVAVSDVESIRLHKGKVVSEMDDDMESESYRTLNLRDDLLVLMRENLYYLQPGFSSFSLASALGITRRGLENLIRILYHVSYEEYVIIQRCEYLRRYRMVYKDEEVTEMAMQCGFQSVDQMSRQLRSYQIYMQPFDDLAIL